MEIGIIGVNYKLANVNLRERLAIICQQLYPQLRFRLKNSYFVILSTCNRIEIYFSGKNLPFIHSQLLTLLRQKLQESFDQKLYSFFHKECFFHLMKVACGLDSAILGETEILGQIKVAYELASNQQVLSKELHFLFQKSLAIAKRIRTEFFINRGMPSLPQAIFSTAKQHFRDYCLSSLLFVGVSEINKKVLNYAKKRGVKDISICNRTDKKACDLAKTQGIRWLKWSQLHQWRHYDWIIFGTKASSYLIQDAPLLNHQKKLIIDLGVPRNVSPLLNNQKMITLLNIDQISDQLSKTIGNYQDSLFKIEEKLLQQVQIQMNIYFEKKDAATFKIKASA